MQAVKAVQSEASISVGDVLATAGRIANVSDSPALDCEILLGHVLGVDRAWLFAHPEHVLSVDALTRFDTLVSKREEGVPVAYLTGLQEFWSISLEVNDSTLIPRPETECLVEAALSRLDADAALAVADLGTGSGAIAIALAIERRLWHIHAVDVSADALEVAKRNGARFAPGHVTFTKGKWLAGFAPASLDAIVTNPPYVRAGDKHLTTLRFEPEIALTGGADGLEDIRTIISDGFSVLKPNGMIFIEHGFDQKRSVQTLMRSRGFTDIEAVEDLAGHSRVSLGRKPAAGP